MSEITEWMSDDSLKATWNVVAKPYTFKEYLDNYGHNHSVMKMLSLTNFKIVGRDSELSKCIQEIYDNPRFTFDFSDKEELSAIIEKRLGDK